MYFKYFNISIKTVYVRFYITFSSLFLQNKHFFIDIFRKKIYKYNVYKYLVNNQNILKI